MADTIPSKLPADRSLLFACTLLIIGCSLFLLNLRGSGAWPLSWSILLRPDPDDLVAISVRYAYFPRFAVALVSGMLLGLSSSILQQTLSNPLAEPGTLGIFAGVRACVAIAILWFPGAMVFGYTFPALAGAAATLALILLLASRSRFSPLFLILTGLVLSLCLDAFTSMLILAHFEELGELLIWQAGSLAQNNWHSVVVLLPCLAVTSLLAALLWRPLTLLDLDEQAARARGLSPDLLRALALLVAVVPAALVASQLGILGFVGLAGAALARVMGARRFKDRILSAPFISGGIMLVTDQILVRLSDIVEIPAGAVTAILGAPLLIFLLYRAGKMLAPQRQDHIRSIANVMPRTSLVIIGFVLMGAVMLALSLVKLPDGWHLSTGADWLELLQWRFPRTAAAAAAGAMLAIAGCLMQRMTGNALASPELLGVSSGAALLMVPLVFLLPPLGRTETMLLASLGSLLFLMLSLKLARRSGFTPEKLLLTGIALTALSGSMLSVVVFFGDVRVTRLIGWMSGSTYSVRSLDAAVALGMFMAACCLLPLLRRWLVIVPLGSATAIALGLALSRARLAMLLVAAVLTGAATLLVGPVTFVGLLAPHLTRLLGLHTPLMHAAGAAMIGALILVTSDWIGRTAFFPWEVPAGLISTMIGALCYGLAAARR